MDNVFLSNVFEFFQLSLGLSIKSAHETEWLKMTWWSGTEEFWKQLKVFGTEWQMCFCLLTFNSRADIAIKYNFNQVRCLLLHLIDFNVQLDTPVKYMNKKFQVFTNMYVCIRYFIGFIFLENVILLVKYLPVIWYFWIHKNQHNRYFSVFVRKLMFLKYSYRKKLKKKWWKTSIFRKGFRLQETFQKFPCILTKFLILKTCFPVIFRNMHFLCAKKLSSRSSQRRLILKYQGNLVIKFDDSVMKFMF